MSNQQTSVEADYEVALEEPVTKYAITKTLEPIKSYFFKGDLPQFRSTALGGDFSLYRSSYKYSGDLVGKPRFVINNFLNGFVQQLENCRKYLFIKLYVDNMGDQFQVNALWITNAVNPLVEVVGDKYDDFDWQEKIDICNNTVGSEFVDVFSQVHDMQSYLH
jgi:hypothetical protein